LASYNHNVLHPSFIYERIDRAKKSEPPNIYEAKSKETVLELNSCSIEAYPSNHIGAYRALDNPKFILIDEGDFFTKGEQEDVRHVSERYIAKSDPYIVIVSILIPLMGYLRE
jgi:hypothetical protein